MLIQDASEQHRDAILALNQSEVPHVGTLTGPQLDRLLAEARYARVVERDGALAAFLIGFGPGADYHSPNYQYFDTRYDRFAYCDRIVVAAASRGLGLGRQLYDDLAALAPGVPTCCEVNVKPPNPDSLAFHARLGFREVGQQDTDEGKKRVALLLRAAPVIPRGR